MKLPKTAKQASIYGASKLLSRAISFLIFVYIARAIGPTNYGVYFYLMSVVTILLPLSRLGMDLELLRKSKRFGEKVAENAFSLYLVASMFAALLCFAIILSRGYSWILAGLTAGFLIARSINTLLSIPHMAKGRVRFISLASVGERIAFSALILLLPAKTSSILISLILSYILADIFLAKKINFKPKKKFDFSYVSLLVLLAGIFVALGERIPILLYDRWFGPTNLGIYGAALAVFQAVALLMNESLTYVQVRMGFMTEQGKRLFRRGSVLLAICLLIGILVSRGLAAEIAEILYGAKYSGVGAVLANLLLSLPAALLIFYPRGEFVYHNIRKLVLGQLFHSLSLIIAAFFATDIVSAGLMYSVGFTVSVTIWWILKYSKFPKDDSGKITNS